MTRTWEQQHARAMLYPTGREAPHVHLHRAINAAVSQRWTEDHYADDYLIDTIRAARAYNDPIEQTQPAFAGTILTCRQPDVGSWNGRPIRLYSVRPDGLDFASLDVLILDKEPA